MKKPSVQQLIEILAEEPDFRFFESRTALHDIIEAKGHLCDFYPKFHCELSPAEPCWAACKKMLRKLITGDVNGLRAAVSLSMRSICAESVRRYFSYCLRNEILYRKLHAANETCEAIEMDRSIIMKAASHRTPASAAAELQRLLSKYGITSDELKCGCCNCEPKIASTCSSLYCLNHGKFTLDNLTEIAQTAASAYRQAAKLEGTAKRRATAQLAQEEAQRSRVEPSISSID